jgi:AraC family transcriptional activator of tynA and feaB
MEWSAKQSQSDQPFGSWADDLAAAFVRLEPRKMAEHPFQGMISRTEAAPIQISRVAASKHRVLRLRSHIARSGDDLCFINLQLEGVGRYTQRGHEQVCGPGDLAVADTTEPFEIANSRDFELFCFAVPRRLLPGHFSDRPRLALSATECGRALSRTLAGYAELCLSAQAPSNIASLGGAHIVDLICHASGVLAEAPSEQIKAPVMLSMMLDHIDRRSGDPGLSAATLARKFRCSERYVHKLFSGTGRSVGEHVNGRRIVACTRDLLDHGRSRTIAEIAFAAGFRDISHFNRLFKRSNGATPREFRRVMASSRG